MCGQRLESSPGDSTVVNAESVKKCQRFQERLRLQLRERYGRQKPMSLPVHHPTNASTNTDWYKSLAGMFTFGHMW